MKSFFLTILLMTSNVFAVEALDFRDVEAAYNKGYAPLLENHVETAIPGRCVHKFDDEKFKASVILVSIGHKGFEIAPLTVNNRPADFFDHLNWIEIFDLYPEVASQFLEVYAGDNHGLILKKDFWGVDKGEIRETHKFFIIKAYKKDKFLRYCYYQK